MQVPFQKRQTLLEMYSLYLLEFSIFKKKKSFEKVSHEIFIDDICSLVTKCHARTNSTSVFEVLANNLNYFTVTKGSCHHFHTVYF